MRNLLGALKVNEKKARGERRNSSILRGTEQEGMSTGKSKNKGEKRVKKTDEKYTDGANGVGDTEQGLRPDIDNRDTQKAPKREEKGEQNKRGAGENDQEKKGKATEKKTGKAVDKKKEKRENNVQGDRKSTTDTGPAEKTNNRLTKEGVVFNSSAGAATTHKEIGLAGKGICTACC